MTEFPANVNGSQFFVWLGCAFLVMLIVNEAFKFAKNVTGRGRDTFPQPLVTQSAVVYSTKQELQEVADQVTEIEKDLKAFRAEIVINGETRRKSIEGKVESVRKEVTEHVESVRRELASEITKMPDRVIAILHNAGKLK